MSERKLSPAMELLMKQPYIWNETPASPSAPHTPEPVAAPLVGTGEFVLLPRALAEDIFCHLLELRAEWQWKKDEPRAGNAREYAALAASADKLGAILHGQENIGSQTQPPSTNQL